MDIASDFQGLLPPRQAAHSEPDDRPLEYLWVYDPQDAKVHVEKGYGDHPADFPTHETMATHVTHPDRQRGYAFSIGGGWRITDEFNHKVEDAFILRAIRDALRGHHAVTPLPHIRHHGDPRK